MVDMGVNFGKKNNLNKWTKNNRNICNAYRARYEANKLNQTPTNTNHEVIQWFYDIVSQKNKQANKTAYHVDHVVPLSKGGLHHEDNLQILTAHQNLCKGAKLI